MSVSPVLTGNVIADVVVQQVVAKENNAVAVLAGNVADGAGQQILAKEDNAIALLDKPFGGKNIKEVPLDLTDCISLEKIITLAKGCFTAQMPCYFFALIEESSKSGYRIFNGSSFMLTYFVNNFKRNPCNREALKETEKTNKVFFYAMSRIPQVDVAAKRVVYTASYFCSLTDMLVKSDKDNEGYECELYKGSVFANDEAFVMDNRSLGYAQLLAYVKFAKLAKQAKNAQARELLSAQSAAWLKLAAGLGDALAKYTLSKEKHISQEERVKLLEEACKINDQDESLFQEKLTGYKNAVLLLLQFPEAMRNLAEKPHQEAEGLKKIQKLKDRQRALEKRLLTTSRYRAAFAINLVDAYLCQGQLKLAQMTFAVVRGQDISKLPPDTQALHKSNVAQLSTSNDSAAEKKQAVSGAVAVVN